MNYLSLQIDGQWVHLSEGVEISLEGNNPLFSDAGSKTYLFQLNVDSNRHLFGNADDIFGDSYYRAIDGKIATLYIAGMPIITGMVALEDEVYIDDDGCIAVNLISGGLEFSEMIDGMNCRDVELKDEFEIGHIYDSFFVTVKIKDPGYGEYDGMTYEEAKNWRKTVFLDFPYGLVDITKGNVSAPYPGNKYCNIRRCYTRNNENIESWYIDNEEFVSIKDGLLSLEYLCYSTGPCFYVMYFLDCLASKLGVVIDRNDLLQIEDAKRLAFVNMGCHVRRGDRAGSRIPVMPLDGRTVTINSLYETIDAGYVVYKAIATSENFPDASVSDVIDALSSMFNVKFLFDIDKKSLSIVSVKEFITGGIYKNVEAEIYNAIKVENRIKGFKLMYSSSSDEDTNYVFDKYSDVEVVSSYGYVLNKVSSLSKKTFIDRRNGNAYVIKIDEDAASKGDEENLNPALFEVGAFSAATIGDCSNEDFVETVEIKFEPIISNDVNGKDNLSKSKADPTNPDIDASLENEYAYFIGDDIENPKWMKLSSSQALIHVHSYEVWVPTDAEDTSVGYYETEYEYNPSVTISFNFFNVLGSISYNSESQVNSCDTGLTVGIMRGAGSESSVEYFNKNFDGEGNYQVAFTPANYAFTSDSIDNCDRDFDYNGKGAGGVDYSGRFSLKIRAGKYDKDGNPIRDSEGNPIVIPSQRDGRGIFDKFWKEYAYFVINKKVVRLRLRMEIADIVSLDWTKRHKIGDYVGFIAKWNVTVGDNGLSEVEMDMYYL